MRSVEASNGCQHSRTLKDAPNWKSVWPPLFFHIPFFLEVNMPNLPIQKAVWKFVAIRKDDLSSLPSKSDRFYSGVSNILFYVTFHMIHVP